MRCYWRCAACALVFVPPPWHPSLVDEKARYDLHRNSPDDAGYRAYLGRLLTPLKARLAPGARGLDFGCGPGPVLAHLLEAAGHSMALYDPFYAPDAAVLEARYDFVTATEVIEHLREPAVTLERVWSCLRPGGWLGIMTQFCPERPAFARWHYKDDFTHLAFFSSDTLHWLARRWNARLCIPESGVALLERE